MIFSKSVLVWAGYSRDKAYCGVKIERHGGVLDRMDSICPRC